MTSISRYDHNGDMKIDHLDVDAYIDKIDPEKFKGSAKHLLELHKNGGQVTGQDWLEFVQEGGKVKGSHILDFVNSGGKLTKEELAALKAAGVEFTPKELKDIRTKLGIPPASSFPPGTTPAELLELFKSGVKVTAEDLIYLKAADGTTPAFVDIKDLIEFHKLGGEVTGQDLIAFQQTGGMINGFHIVDFLNAGGTLTADELVTLAKGGSTIMDSQVKQITEKLGITLTPQQYLDLKVVHDPRPDFQENFAPGFTM